MGMVKRLYEDYCEAVHPDDADAQDKLFEQLCSGSVQVSEGAVRAKIKEYRGKRTWQEIQAFAKQLVGLTQGEEETWAGHSICRPMNLARCNCAACQKHALYTHIVEALERWEKRRLSVH